MLEEIKEFIKDTKVDGIVTRLKCSIFWDEITNYVNDPIITNNSEIVYLYINQMKPPVCSCNNINRIKFETYTKGYRTFCSSQCSAAKKQQVKNRVATQNANGGIGLARKSAYEKKNKTMLEKYGYENYFGTEEHIKNCIENNPMHNSEVILKIKQECLTDFGVDWHSKRGYSQETAEILNNPEKLKELYENMHTNTITKQLDIDISTLYRYLLKYNIREKYISCGESQVFEYVKSIINKRIMQRTRSVLENKQELDIFIPDLMVGIEYCGLYWHSQLSPYFKTSKYHQDKFFECKKLGIKLITIFEDEWRFKQNICKQRLSHILNVANTKSIGARLINVTEIVNENDKRICKEFIDTYHIQQDVATSVKIGGYYQNNLVGVMTFSKERYVTKQIDWEIVRYCTNGNYPGLASKMLLKFIEIYNPETIISFADLRWGDGSFYEKLGFKLNRITNPNYHVFDGNDMIRYSRIKFQRHKLEDLFQEKFDENLTEWDILQMKGFNKIWDCGNAAYVWMKG